MNETVGGIRALRTGSLCKAKFRRVCGPKRLGNVTQIYRTSDSSAFRASTLSASDEVYKSTSTLFAFELCPVIASLPRKQTCCSRAGGCLAGVGNCIGRLELFFFHFRRVCALKTVLQTLKTGILRSTQYCRQRPQLRWCDGASVRKKLSFKYKTQQKRSHQMHQLPNIAFFSVFCEVFRKPPSMQTCRHPW